jgi:hypothetical protein
MKLMSKRQVRYNLVNFFDLSKDWQKEALSNSEQELAEQTTYLEPLESDVAGEHILWDLSQVMPIGKLGSLTVGGETVSNNTYALFYIDWDAEECVLKIR